MGSLLFKGEACQERGVVFFGEGGVDTPMHTMYGTWKSTGTKLNAWTYDLIEQLNKIIELNHRTEGNGIYVTDIMHVFKAHNPTCLLEGGKQNNEYYFC